MCSIDGLEIAILVGVVIIAVIGMFLAFRYGYSYRKKVAETKIGSAEDEAKRIIDSAKSKSLKDAENTKKEKLLEAKEEIHKERNELEKEIKERRNAKTQISNYHQSLPVVTNHHPTRNRNF